MEPCLSLICNAIHWFTLKIPQTYAVADRLGGMEQARKLFSRYGQSRSPEVKALSEENKTTTDYYIHVLEYLWNHQEKYADLLN